MIKVKFIGSTALADEYVWGRQLPAGDPVCGNCRFTFDFDATDYDWLVVYDEVPLAGVELACPREHTVLVTAEPHSIKVYGSAYTRQFGAVLTSHPDWALSHPGAIRAMPCLQWFYGLPTIYGQGTGELRSYEQIRSSPIDAKTHDLSTVCSNKRMGHTLHRLRFDFTMALREAMPEFDWFGRGIRDINDKAEALDGYRYHIAIENHVGPHHITEKLTDPFLAGALPFYFGAPNASDYFPEESFIPIDIRKTDKAIATIRQAIENHEYEKRMDAIREAKRRVLEEQNLFAVLAKQIERLDTGERGAQGEKLLNRRVLRKRSPISAVRYLIERYTVQARSRRESGV